MGSLSESLLVFATSGAYRLLVIGMLLVACAVAWRECRRERTAGGRCSALASVVLLACVSLAIPFAFLARARSLPPEAWVAPFDRLVVVACLVMLGWSLLPSRADRRWSTFLAGVLAAASLAYVWWAARWWQAYASGNSAPAGAVAVAWDLAAAALALGLALALACKSPDVPRWTAAILTIFAMAGLAEAAVPADPYVPLWWRLGMLAAAVAVAAAAFAETAELREPAAATSADKSSQRAQRGRARLARATMAAEADGRGAGPLPPDISAYQAATVAASSGPASGTPPEQGVAAHGSRGTGAPPRGGRSRTAARESPSPAADAPRRGPATGAAAAGQGRAAAEPARSKAPYAVRDAPAETPAAVVASREPEFAVAPTNAPTPDGGNASARRAAGLARDPDGAASAADPLERIARLEVAMMRLPNGVIVTDSQGRVLYGNPAAARLLLRAGITPGRNAAELFSDPARVAHLLRNVLRGEAGGEGSAELVLEDRGVRVGARRLEEADGECVGALIVVDQPTDEPPSPELDLLPPLAAALDAPMASISGYSGLLGDGGQSDGDQVDRYLRRIDANLARMQLLLANLLTTMDLATLAEPTAPEPVDVGPVVAESVTRAQTQYREKRLIVSVATDELVPRVSADPTTVAQIVDNLLANAAQRSPQGGEVVVRLERRDDTGGRGAVVLSVRDHGAPLGGAGHGLYEIDDGSSDAVGLTVTRLLAERHGGRTWAESDPHGMTYYVRLPLSAARRRG